MRTTPRLRATGGARAEILTVLGDFAEVWLAKEGHDGLVGINYLEKIQLATAPAMFGAILAGVDHVLVGAGVPGQIPALASRLARCEPCVTKIALEGEEQPVDHLFDPGALLAGHLPGPLRRPSVIAIVSLPVLAAYLARDEATRPDGFVIETSGAAPSARAEGAAGVQVGSAFALCEESAMAPHLREELRGRAHEGTLTVRNDPEASPTAFPFEVAELPGTVSEPEVAAARRRVCDLGFLRTPVRGPRGLAYRCAAEPVGSYVRKGGDAADTRGRQCLCNGLLATIGLAQRRPGGRVEPPLVTIGKDLSFLPVLSPGAGPYTAADVVRWPAAGAGEQVRG
ncbi:hypothetical protein ACFWUZ_17000 [Streptomyces sp. NPDC058646]|uniref:hypothetical protein n=1 Tax=Streptomyces sp. NPDC058646 TaxID=3346574 RepID=UPI003667D5EB